MLPQPVATTVTHRLALLPVHRINRRSFWCYAMAALPLIMATFEAAIVAGRAIVTPVPALLLIGNFLQLAVGISWFFFIRYRDRAPILVGVALAILSVLPLSATDGFLLWALASFAMWCRWRALTATAVLSVITGFLNIWVVNPVAELQPTNVRQVVFVAIAMAIFTGAPILLGLWVGKKR